MWLKSALVCYCTLAVAVALPTAAPSLSITSSNDRWEESLRRARTTVSQLSTQDKLTLVSGIGFGGGACVGNIAKIDAIPDFNGLCLQDGPAGVRYQYYGTTSAFTSALNVAATFDKELMLASALAMGEEFRLKGVNVALAPMTNIMRTPEGGRNWEGYGEDPYLSSIATYLTTLGLEHHGVMATVKHYFGNEQEHFRDTGISYIDDETLHELYLPPFKAAIEAGVSSVMCAYNKIKTSNGEVNWACEHDTALNKVLKGELGFKGFVMTDWFAGHSTEMAALNGLDMWMPNPVSENMTVPLDRLDDMATRILGAWYKNKQDQEYPETNFNSFYPDEGLILDVKKDHHKIIRRVGSESMILLKNINGALPLNFNTVKKVAVVGANAKSPQELNRYPDQAGVDGHVAIGWGSGTANFPYLSSPLDAITQKSKECGFQVATHVDTVYNKTSIDAVASDADVALVFAYANSGEGYLVVQKNNGDRNDLHLWDQGSEMIQAVAAVNKQTIVVITSPGAVDMSEWIHHPNITAVVLALFPGQESGNAIMDVISGKVNPSGRLPFTIAKQDADYCCHVNRKAPGHVDYTEKTLVGYRWFDQHAIEPLFPFGFGLSFTTFDYSELSLVMHDQNTWSLSVSLKVENTGQVAGAEIVQLYLTYPSHVQRPPLHLKGFDKIYLQPQQSKRVTLTLVEKDVSVWNQGWHIPRGTFTIKVGSHSRNMRLSGTFTIE